MLASLAPPSTTNMTSAVPYTLPPPPLIAMTTMTTWLQDDYIMSASLAVSIVRATLGLGAGQAASVKRPASALQGVVVNVNFPIGQACAVSCVCACMRA